MPAALGCGISMHHFWVPDLSLQSQAPRKGYTELPPLGGLWHTSCPCHSCLLVAGPSPARLYH